MHFQAAGDMDASVIYKIFNVASRKLLTLAPSPKPKMKTQHHDTEDVLLTWADLTLSVLKFAVPTCPDFNLRQSQRVLLPAQSQQTQRP